MGNGAMPNGPSYREPILDSTFCDITRRSNYVCLGGQSGRAADIVGGPSLTDIGAIDEPIAAASLEHRDAARHSIGICAFILW